MKVASPFLAPLVAALALCAACARGERPPVILITVDTLRPDHLGAYGYERPTSPAIDRLAREGTLFETAIAQAPWTLPSVASLVTSRLPTELGATGVFSRLPAGAVALSHAFKSAGYRTAAVVSGDYLTTDRGFERGFDVFREIPEGGRAQAVNEAVLALLATQGKGPLFLWVHYFDPHSDYDAPQPWGGKFATAPVRPGIGTTSYLKRVMNGDAALDAADVEGLKALYDGEIGYVDSRLGALVGRLGRDGVLDRAVLAFGADHGEAFMEHGRVLHVSSLYDELIRVPLVLRAPGRVPAGMRVKAMVRNLDIAPTLLDLAGLAPPPSFEGRTLLPLLEGRDQGGRTAFSHTDMTSHEKLFAARMPNLNRALFDVLFMARTDRWKVVYSRRRSAYETFDLYADPRETRNLHPSTDADARALKEALDAWVRAVPESAPDAATPKLPPGQIERLKALGYGS
jgi:arylsulfatase A-like enzyme